MIKYTTSDGLPIDYDTYSITNYTGAVTSNTYENGQGILAFENVLTRLGYSAFKNKTVLTSIVIPESVTLIDDYALYNTSLANLVVPNSVTTINTKAFGWIPSLKSLTLGKKVSSIGGQFLYYCTNLEEIICLNPEPPALAGDAFTNFNLSSVTLKVPAASIEAYRAASGWSGFTNIVSVDNQIIYYTSTDGNVVTPYANNFGGANIVSNTYDDGQGMIVFDADVTEVGTSAFEFDKKISSVVLPNSITAIGENCFYKCSALSTVFMGERVSSLGQRSFIECENLQEITVLNPIPPSTYYFTFSAVPKTTCIIKVPTGSVDAYKAANNWKDFTNIVGLSQTFNIVDGENYDRTAQISGVGINYDRTFKNDAWQPLYIPFSMEYSEWSAVADIAEISGVHEYNDGTTLIKFRTLESGETQPNTPYLIRGKAVSNDPVVLELTDKTLCAAPVENGSVWCASTRRKYTLTGIYAAQDNLAGSLVMSGGNFYTVTSPTTTLKAQRFYLTITDEDHGYGTTLGMAGAPQFVGVMVDGETTGISLTPVLSQGDGAAYNLAGQKVGADYKGIVIVNGRKVLKK